MSIIRLIDDDPDKIVFNDVIKAFFLGGDLRLVTTDEVWSDGEIPIFDMNNVTLRHLTKVVFRTLGLFMKYSQEAHPVVVKQIHIVNCGSMLNRVMLLVKPFLKAENAEKIQTHLPNSKTLFNYVPKDILPKEYGGTGGSIEATSEIRLQVLENYRWIFQQFKLRNNKIQIMFSEIIWTTMKIGGSICSRISLEPRATKCLQWLREIFEIADELWNKIVKIDLSR